MKSSPKRLKKTGLATLKLMYTEKYKNIKMASKMAAENEKFMLKYIIKMCIMVRLNRLQLSSLFHINFDITSPLE